METPSYHYLPKETEKNIKLFNTFLENDIEIFYAIKASNYAPLIRRFLQNRYGFDVASKEEIEYLVNMGASTENMCFSAPTKLIEDIQFASKKGVRYYAFDSEEEVKKILKYAKNPLLFARIATKNRDADFDLSDIFGMTEAYYTELLQQAKRDRWPLYGLTFHVGSQNKSIFSWYKAMDQMERLISLTREADIQIECINLGGGIPTKNKSSIKPTEYYIDSIIRQVKNLKKRTNVKRFIVEPGRALSANTMYLLTKVVNIKPYKNPPVLVTDVSVFNGLIEVLENFEFYVQKHKSKIPSTENKIFKISGISCAGSDVIQKRCLLPSNTKVGDLLVVPYTGAYTFICENFHMRKFPKIVCD